MKLISDMLEERARCMAETDFSEIPKISKLIVDALRDGRKIMACGCGGSAAQADHLVSELVGKYETARIGLSAVSMNSAPTLTAIVNDFGADEMFSRQVLAVGSHRDVLIAITTSGTSASVVKAVRAARLVIGMDVVVLTSLKYAHRIESDKPRASLSDVKCTLVRAATKNTAVAQEVHLTMIHMICAMVDNIADPYQGRPIGLSLVTP